MPAFIVSVLLLVACHWAGEALVRWLAIPVPGAMVGLVLLTAGLLALGRVPAALGRVGGGLLRNMMLLLAPAVVGLIDNIGRVREEWLPFLAASVVGAVVTLAVTAVVLQRLLRARATQPTDERAGADA